MKLANMLLEKFGIDKFLHFLGGAWIVSMLSPIGWTGIIIGLIIMLVLSVVKEAFLDEFFDFKDIIAAVCGSAVSVLIYLAVSLLL